ncbi:MAG: ATP-binding protein, partial [Deltaproteobacteria bacterium]|nr:ATP-binding protein [Deltaproteobacteria bacterium]
CSPVGEALCSCLDRLPLPSLLLASSSLPEAGGLPARTTRRIQLRFPGETLRAGFWRAHLQLGEAPPLPEEDALALVAARYELGPGQVRNAARDWLWAAPSSSLQGLQAAAARQLASDPGSVVRIRRVQLGLDDLVLPREELEQVREILQACRNHFALLHRWGFRQRLAYGTGIVCLFSGEPGTGKTLCAQILASELGQDLFLVSLPDILSRWVGETEKQIARIFHEAKAAQAILLFDEADSLLGARTEVHSSSDRYANIATNFLLQEIEAYEGVVILTTNLEQNLDSAAARRILFRLRFPFPDVDGRRKLWQQLIPRQALQAKEIDFAALAEAFELSGGHIKNAIVRAAYEALERGRPIDTAGLAKAGVRECRAIGKLVRDEVPDRPVPRRKRRR